MNIYKKFLIIGFPVWVYALAHILVEYNKVPLCLWKAIFHTECWGCGITRAFYALCHLDFNSAWNYNSKIYIIAPLFFLWSLISVALFFGESENHRQATIAPMVRQNNIALKALWPRYLVILFFLGWARWSFPIRPGRGEVLPLWTLWLFLVYIVSIQ